VLRAVLGKKTQVFALTLVLSVFLTATIASAATEFIKANKGGVIEVVEGVKFKIKKNGMREDAIICVDMVWQGDEISFQFGPCGTLFHSYKDEKKYEEKLQKYAEKLDKELDKHGADSEKYAKKLEEYKKKLQKELEKYQKNQLEKDAELEVSWKIVEGAEDLTLYYGEGGEEIEPYKIKKNKIIWRIPHFSIYYFRRR